MPGMATDKKDRNDSGGEDRNENGHMAWVPKHMILGAWPVKAPRSTMEKEARDWPARQGEEVRDRCLQPYTPKK